MSINGDAAGREGRGRLPGGSLACALALALSAATACYHSDADGGDASPDDAVPDIAADVGTVDGDAVEEDVGTGDDGTADGETLDVEGAGDEGGDEDAVGPVDDGGDDAADAPPCDGFDCLGCVDPPDGPVGMPCTGDSDCTDGLTCDPEVSEYWHGVFFVYYRGGYCRSSGVDETACDPHDAASCPEGARCSYLGTDRDTGETYFGCLDACDAFAEDGSLHEENCDCRDGYECNPYIEACLAGCSNDLECCMVWHDLGPGICDPEPCRHWDVLDPAACTNYCDTATWRCVNRGCPSGACALGDICRHDAECPAGTRCSAALGRTGVCVQEFCDRPARPCPAGTTCASLSDLVSYFVCLRACTPRVPPTESGCADGTACHELRSLTGGVGGGCLPPCAFDADCVPGTVCDPASQGCIFAP